MTVDAQGYICHGMYFQSGEQHWCTVGYDKAESLREFSCCCKTMLGVHFDQIYLHTRTQDLLIPLQIISTCSCATVSRARCMFVQPCKLEGERYWERLTSVSVAPVCLTVWRAGWRVEVGSRRAGVHVLLHVDGFGPFAAHMEKFTVWCRQ